MNKYTAVVTILTILSIVCSPMLPLATGADGASRGSTSGGPSVSDLSRVDPMTIYEYGPKNVKKIAQTGAFTGAYRGGFVDDINGDGCKDLVFYTYDGVNNRFSALNGKDLSPLWSNKSEALGFGLYDFGAIDIDGSGTKDIFLRTNERIFVMDGKTGAEAWSYPLEMMFYGYRLGDVNGDGTMDATIGYSVVGGAFYRSINLTSGTLVFDSGPIAGGSSFYLGQIDNDKNLELFVRVSNTGPSDYRITVIDTVTNTTEWSRPFVTDITDYVANDFDNDGKTEFVTRAETPTRLTMYSEANVQVWTNNSYSSPAFFTGIADVDSDKNLELYSSDWATKDIEVIDGVTGFRQGYWFSGTCPPGTTYPLTPLTDGTTYLVSYCQAGMGTMTVTFFNGSDLSVKRALVLGGFPVSILLSELDGNAGEEVMITVPSVILAYNAKTMADKWQNAVLGGMSGIGSPGIGWVLGNTTGTGNKIKDLVYTYKLDPSHFGIAFLNSSNGWEQTSNTVFSGVGLDVANFDGDAYDEVLLHQTWGTGSTLFRLLKADHPPTVSAIPGVNMVEDTSLPAAVNLSAYIKDDGVSGPLQFGVVPSGGGQYVIGTVNGTFLDLAPGVKDWNGQTSLNLTVNDGFYPIVTVRIDVHVAPVDDAPTIKPLGHLIFFEDKVADFRAIATDAENDTLAYSDNTTLFDIDAVTGKVNFTPVQAQVGDHAVQVKVTQVVGCLSAYENFTITILNTNDRPRMITNDSLEAIEDRPYEVDYNVTDEDVGDTHTWTVQSNFSWLRMNSSTGVLNGTPTNDDVGKDWVNVTVMDRGLLSDHHNFTLEVVNTNDRPEWTDVPGNTTINVMDKFHFDVNATDMDVGDVVRYSISSVPSTDIRIDKDTGVIDWQPTSPGARRIALTASDGTAEIKHNLTITVLAPNGPPSCTLLAPANGTGSSGQKVVFQWSVSDPDGDNVTSDLYVGKSLADVKATALSVRMAKGLKATNFTAPALVFEPGTTYYWLVVPYDGELYGKCTNGVFTLKTLSTNNPPKIEVIPDKKAKVGKELKVSSVGSDPDAADAGKLVWGLVAPKGANINKTTGKITWVPSKDQVGENTFTVTLTDGRATANRTFKVTVEKETSWFEQSGALLLALLVVVIAVIAMVVVVVLRRKKGKASGQGPAEGLPEGPVGPEPSEPED